MNSGKKIATALALSLGFVMLHIFIASFKPTDISMLIFTLVLMTIMEVLGYFILKRSAGNGILKFSEIFLFLCGVMSLTVILLGLNSALNPYVEKRPFQPSEVLVSLLIFSVLFTGILSGVLWLYFEKGRKKIS